MRQYDQDTPAAPLPGCLIIPYMSKLIAVIGASGVGKTAFVRALALAHPFATAYEQHVERPFQARLAQDAAYALGNQIDYLLVRAEQEKALRRSPGLGLIDGGLDLDFHGFTRLFHRRGMLTDLEFDLCRRLYRFLRELLPAPELLVRLCADQVTIASRLAERDRINIARAEDTALFDAFLDEWLATLPKDQILELDVTHETVKYEQSVKLVIDRIQKASS